MRSLLREGLRRLVDREGERPRGGLNALVIAVSAQKGGVGKTTTSVNLAAALARFHGARVLLIDLDPQGHVATSLRSMRRPGGSPLSDILLRERGGDIMDAVATTSLTGVDLTPSDPSLREAEERLGSRIGKEVILRDALRTARTHYDYIILDCPPNAGTLTVNALVSADRVLIPCDPGPLAVRGVETLLQLIGPVHERLNPGLDILGIVITRLDGRNTRLNEEIMEELQTSFGEALIPTAIGINTRLAQAQQAGEDIFTHAPDSRGATDYQALADWLVSVTGAR